MSKAQAKRQEAATRTLAEWLQELQALRAAGVAQEWVLLSRVAELEAQPDLWDPWRGAFDALLESIGISPLRYAARRMGVERVGEVTAERLGIDALAAIRRIDGAPVRLYEAMALRLQWAEAGRRRLTAEALARMAREEARRLGLLPQARRTITDKEIAIGALQRIAAKALPADECWTVAEEALRAIASNASHARS